MRSWYVGEIHQPYALVHDAEAAAGALLIHGFTGSPADMRAVADVVHAHGIDAQVMVLPGMAGEIDRLNQMTAKMWRDAVLERWRAHCNQYAQRILVGYSMGGALATLAAVDEPPDLLILIAPLSRIADRRAVFLPLAKYVMRGVRPYARLDWNNPHVHEWFQRTRPSIPTHDPLHQVVLTNEAIYSARMLAELRRLLAWSRRAMTKARMPVVIVQGTEDRLVLPGDTRKLVGKVGGPVRYEEIPGDHYLPLPAFGHWPGLKRILDDVLRMGTGPASEL